MAAQAAYLVANQEMDDYLQDTLDVDSARLRYHWMKAGFRRPTKLVAANQDKFIYRLCTNIRKGEGTAAAKNTGAELEEELQRFQTWCMYRHLTQRDFDYAEATLDNLADTSAWITQLSPDPSDTQVDPLADRGDRSGH